MTTAYVCIILMISQRMILFIVQEMLHIADTKMARRYGDFFIRQIHKLEEVHNIGVRVCYNLLLCLVSRFAAVFKRLTFALKIIIINNACIILIISIL